MRNHENVWLIFGHFASVTPAMLGLEINPARWAAAGLLFERAPPPARARRAPGKDPDPVDDLDRTNSP
jgi:hypothetical protein